MLNWPRRYCPGVIIILATLLTIGGCALPPLTDRVESASIPAKQTADTRLGRAITPLLETHQGNSGVVLLKNAHDAFAARALLADGADATLDIQYYIWQNDITDTMLLNEIGRAHV